MTSFHGLVLCLTLAQSSWEKPADFDSAAVAEKAEKCWREGRRQGQEARLGAILPAFWGPWGPGHCLGGGGVKQGERSKRCSEKQLAFLSVLCHPRGGKTGMQEIQRGPRNVTSYEPWDTGALVAKGLASRAGVASAPTGSNSYVRFQI